MARPSSALEVGDRVFLRVPIARDREELLELTRVSRRLHGPWAATPATPDAFAAWLRRTRDPRVESFLVCLKDGEAIVGVFNLSEIVRGPFQSAYTGYWAHAGYAGKGYMSEGLGLLLRQAFRGLRLHRLEANIQPGNARSIALVRRAGFRCEGLSPRYLKIGGRWRDHERWADHPRGVAEPLLDEAAGRAPDSGRRWPASTLRQSLACASVRECHPSGRGT